MDGRRAGQLGGRLRQYWFLPPGVGRRERPLLHPLKTARQIILFVVVCLGLDALGAVTLPWEWSRWVVNTLSLIVAFAVVELAYRRWWQPVDQ